MLTIVCLILIEYSFEKLLYVLFMPKWCYVCILFHDWSRNLHVTVMADCPCQREAGRPLLPIGIGHVSLSLLSCRPPTKPSALEILSLLSTFCCPKPAKGRQRRVADLVLGDCWGFWKGKATDTDHEFNIVGKASQSWRDGVAGLCWCSGNVVYPLGVPLWTDYVGVSWDLWATASLKQSHLMRSCWMHIILLLINDWRDINRKGIDYRITAI